MCVCVCMKNLFWKETLTSGKQFLSVKRNVWEGEQARIQKGLKLNS